MVITYQLPETATLAWVPIVEANEKWLWPACGMGQCKDGTWIAWWGPKPPRGDYQSLTEQRYPDGGGIKAPQIGDVIECSSGSFRVVRTLRACKACDVSLDEIEQMDMPVMRAWKGELGPDAFWKEMIGDAWQHWGWLVEVKAESEVVNG